MKRNDITRTGAMSRYHVKGARPKAALGDYDIQACLDAGASLQVCQQAAAASQAAGNPFLTTVSASGTPATGTPAASSSSSGGFLSAFGTGLATLFGPKPGVLPIYPQVGMSDTTKILLLGGGALALVLLARR